jgi:hypothetical protein
MTIWRAGKSLDTRYKQMVRANSPKGWKWVYHRRQLEEKLNQSPALSSYHSKKMLSGDDTRYKVSDGTSEKLIDMLIQEKDARISYLTKEVEDKNKRIQFLESRSDNLIGRVLEVLKLNSPKEKRKHPIEMESESFSEPGCEVQEEPLIARPVNGQETVIEMPPRQTEVNGAGDDQSYPQDTPQSEGV